MLPESMHKIFLHDNSGHAFTVQLSRALAGNGHSVLHTHMQDFVSPKGLLQKTASDPDLLRIEGLSLGGRFEKYSYVKRWMQEREFGRLLKQKILSERPDVFIACNTSPAVLAQVIPACHRQDIRVIFWVQDLYGHAAKRILRKRLGGLGELAGSWFERTELGLIRTSDQVVVITDDFVDILDRAGVKNERISIVQNWAPIEDIAVQPKNNQWSREKGLHDKFVLLYSGTLGLKHDPELLVLLAEHFRDSPGVEVVVITEGIGAEYLSTAAVKRRAPNLRLLPYQPYRDMSAVVASADVLLAMLEPGAGTYSVPSKVLTYLCAKRPILLSAPAENLASRTLLASQAGMVERPDCPEAFCKAARVLHDNESLRHTMAANGREYAERNFPIGGITRRFEAIIASAMRR